MTSNTSNINKKQSLSDSIQKLLDSIQKLLEKPCINLLSYLSVLLSPIFLLKDWCLILGYILYIVILPFIMFKFLPKNEKLLNYIFKGSVYLIFVLFWLGLFMLPALRDVVERLIELENRSAIYNSIYSIIGTDCIVNTVGVLIILFLLVTTAIPFIKYLYLYNKILVKK